MINCELPEDEAEDDDKVDKWSSELELELSKSAWDPFRWGQSFLQWQQQFLHQKKAHRKNPIIHKPEKNPLSKTISSRD